MIETVTTPGGNRLHKFTCDGEIHNDPYHDAPKVYRKQGEGLKARPPLDWSFRETGESLIHCPDCTQDRLDKVFTEIRNEELARDTKKVEDALIWINTETRIFRGENTTDGLQYVVRCWHQQSGTRTFMEGARGEYYLSVAECAKINLIEDVRASDWYKNRKELEF
jgi:hypothetical protein